MTSIPGRHESIEPQGGCPRILVAEDNLTNRKILGAMLEAEGFDVLAAENGRVAVESFERHQPDVVLMDIEMPELDGYEATRLIKRSAGERFVPVIFLTAKHDDESLARCIECGGDDFLTKPYSKVILRAKLDALMRVRQLHGNIRSQRDELKYHQERLRTEHEIARLIFANVVHSRPLGAAGVKCFVSPLALFNGDLLLAEQKPSGGLRLLMGDFTGHGLSAAIGAMPVSDIFRQMTASGFAIGEVAREINRKLRRILPTGLFFAASLIDLDRENGSLLVWNGGCPDVLISGGDGSIRHRIRSTHVPLGILPDDQFDPDLELIEVRPGERVFVYSDGVVEIRNPRGEFFGSGRLEAIFDSCPSPDGLFDQILAELARFREGQGQEDDITLVELSCGHSGDDLSMDVERGRFRPRGSSAWRLALEFSGRCLRELDPLPLVLQNVIDLQGLQSHRERIYTVLAELFANSLDHGLLGLDSRMKESPNGFVRFYELRGKRLETLSTGWIHIDITHEPRGDNGGVLRIKIADSGPGFDHDGRRFPTFEENTSHSGRGIPLVRQFCSEVRFEGTGNAVTVVYPWS